MPHGLNDPWGIAVDPAGGKLYWCNRIAGKIQRSNLDGSGVEDLITDVLGPRAIALDVAGGTMYWIEFSAWTIHRSNLDGSADEVLVESADVQKFLGWMALDLQAGKMYWTDSDFFFFEAGGSIRRANLDGSAIEDVLVSGTIPDRIALDPGAGKIYWTDSLAKVIRRANLDGSMVEDLVEFLPGPKGIALDLRPPAGIPTLSEFGYMLLLVSLLASGWAVLARRARSMTHT